MTSFEVKPEIDGTGGTVVWKKVHDVNGNDLIVKLSVSEGTRIRYATMGGRVILCRMGNVGRGARYPLPDGGAKARAEGAFVEQVYKPGKKTHVRRRIAGFSGYASCFAYRPGSYVECYPKWEQTPRECAPGIHFFFSRAAAEAYNL